MTHESVADTHSSPRDVSSPPGLWPPAAAAMASAAYLVPYLLSRSTAPTPNHPRVFAWYQALKKPWYNPPDLIFPISWTAIETGLAWSAYRLLVKPSTQPRNLALALLAGNVLGIGGWSRIFFGRRNLALSTVSAAALGVSAAAYTVQSKKVDSPAALASLPLVGWVAFATLLTASIWRRNPR